MPLTDLARYALAAAYTGLMVWAAVSDIRSRLIPNQVVLILLALFIPWTLLSGGLLPSLEAFGIALVVSVALYAFKVVGAGDSKLFAAAALFAGMDYLPQFALATALTGGAVALVSLASRPQRAFAMIMLRGKGDWGRGVPYGVAIAIGGTAVLWASMFGALEPFSWDGTPRVSTHDILHSLEPPRR
jgi:prepilin peptidase CpaA